MNFILIIVFVIRKKISIFVPKPNNILSASMFKLTDKTDFKSMLHLVHIIISAFYIFYLGKNSFRNITRILKVDNNVKDSHTTISNWCKKFTQFFNNLALKLVPTLNLILMNGILIKLIS